ncbi:hypothetical protein [Halobacillus trueperi]|uniref:hypothetical protein n=1 Tax=Halobacillus trueperi TaxID=156205 RepID=UPI003735C7DF
MRIIWKLRNNDNLLLVVFISMLVTLIGGAILTTISLIFAKFVIIISIAIMIYLMVFLGVNPIYKGLFFMLIPVLSTFALTKLLELLPNEMYPNWIAVDTARGYGPAGIFFFLWLK